MQLVAAHNHFLNKLACQPTWILGSGCVFQVLTTLELYSSVHFLEALQGTLDPKMLCGLYAAVSNCLRFSGPTRGASYGVDPLTRDTLPSREVSRP